MIVRDGSSPFRPACRIATIPSVQEIRGGFPFVVVHAGNLGFYGAWDTLLKAAEILRNENTGLVFVGDGANRAAMEASAADSPNVRFLPFRPVERDALRDDGGRSARRHRASAAWRASWCRASSIRFSLRAVRCWLSPRSSAMRRASSVESGCGLAADPDDPDAVAAAIRELRDDPERLAEMGRRARETAEKYDRVNELQRFVSHRGRSRARTEREGVIWNRKKVLVTGGTSFIGSHLVDALARARRASSRRGRSHQRPARATSSSTSRADASHFMEADLREPGVTRAAMQGIEVVFHLAADHGGRGYVDLHQAGPASNLFLDGLVFWEAVKAGVEKVVFASSGCVYPNFMQSDVEQGNLSSRRRCQTVRTTPTTCTAGPN